MVLLSFKFTETVLLFVGGAIVLLVILPQFLYFALQALDTVFKLWNFADFLLDIRDGVHCPADIIARLAMRRIKRAQRVGHFTPCPQEVTGVALPSVV